MIPEKVFDEARAISIRVFGWLNEEHKKAWNWSFPLMEVSARVGDVSLSDPAWVMVKNPWTLLRNNYTVAFQLMVVLRLHVASQEMEMGVLQHNLIMSPSEGQTRDMLRQIGWNLRVKAKSLPPVDKWSTLEHQIPHEYNNVEL